jgi:hypothetical protein
VPWGSRAFPPFWAMPNALQTLVMLVAALALLWCVGPDLGRSGSGGKTDPQSVSGPQLQGADEDDGSTDSHTKA